MKRIMANAYRIAGSARGNVASCQYEGGGMKSILDRSFQYTPSAETDLKKTFLRIRRRLEEQQHAQARADAEVEAKFTPIKQARPGVIHAKARI
jgi:hypothetical protein